MPKTPKKTPQKKYKNKIILKKTGCCCGATLRTPCVCMITGEKCKSSGKMCSCFRLKHNQNK